MLKSDKSFRVTGFYEIVSNEYRTFLYVSFQNASFPTMPPKPAEIKGSQNLNYSHTVVLNALVITNLTSIN